jgi:hypothetical protein
MLRLTLVSICAAAALAGCASRAQQHPVEQASTSSGTYRDPRGDAVDASGAPRRGRPDVDITSVSIDRNPNRTLVTITAAAPPRGPLHFEIFGQTPDVDGYDVVSVARRGNTVSGYVAFENSAAKLALPQSSAISFTGSSLSVNVPIDPIFGATPFQWRVTVRTSEGAAISDSLPSRTGLRTFPPPRRGG